ncbi:MAG TPA: FtsH protease activity modulator HflK [Candidatus Polarisedimenticolia bacterium]|nr:FtsH protease activity modulator HflK [Candidatus Polarisedimenticolia bacterium]
MVELRGVRDVAGPRLPPEWRRFLAMLPSLLALVFVLVAAATSFFTVAQDQVAVIQRWGRYVRTVPSGLHFKLPFGIERVTKVRVEYVYKEEFGFTSDPGVRRPGLRPSSDQETRQMLTGDLNIADVEWIVQFKIRDPKAYVFKVRNVPLTLRNVSEAVMRRVVGDRSVTEVLTVGRAEIAALVEKDMQQLFDQYETGLVITTVQLKDVNPPEPVKPSFNEVNEARQEKERTTNQAWEAYNKAIPEAEGAARRTVSEAEGYAINRVNRARGDAQRFSALLTEYRRAPDVTRRRLYIEAMSDILPKIERKYIVDDQVKGLLPLLDLGRPTRPQGGAETQP